MDPEEVLGQMFSKKVDAIGMVIGDETMLMEPPIEMTVAEVMAALTLAIEVKARRQQREVDELERRFAES